MNIKDYEYLSPIIREIEKERSEREDLESMVVKKRIPGSKIH
jgi:ubiquinol-cytochrome c reductase subunit 7